MQRVAMGWIAYRLSGSELVLGVVGFSGQIPIFAFTSVAGVFADRLNRRALLLVAQSLAMAQALFLAVLVFTDAVQVWHLIVLALFLGVVNALDMPVRQAFTVEMVGDKKILGNAIALNSSIVSVSRFVGPSVAGLLIAAVGEGVCFLINGLSYLAVIAALLAMRFPSAPKGKERKRLFHELREGLVFALDSAPIRLVLMVVALVSLFGMPFSVLLPVFAKDILGGGSQTLGFLTSAAGAGSLAGAMFLASRKDGLGLGRILALAAGVTGMGLAAFSVSGVFWLSLLFLFAVGWGVSVQMASANTILQTLVPDEMRGRVMGLFVTCFIGLFPFGSLLAGGLADTLGAPMTVTLGGTICLLGALVFSRKLALLGEAPGATKEERDIFSNPNGGSLGS